MRRRTLPAPTSVAAQIAYLPGLPMDELWALWDECFDARPTHHNRDFVEARLAYRLQERAFGALSPITRRKLEAIGRQVMCRIRNAKAEFNSLLARCWCVNSMASSIA